MNLKKFSPMLPAKCLLLIKCALVIEVAAQKAQNQVYPWQRFKERDEFVGVPVDQDDPDATGRWDNGVFRWTFDTEVGGQYRLSYLMGTRGGPEVGVRTEVFSLSGDTLGHSETFLVSDSAALAPTAGFDFLATTPSTKLRLFDISPAGQDWGTAFVENVTVTAVPEPGVMALVGVGLMGFGFFRRLRR